MSSLEELTTTRTTINSVSSSFCLAKWLQQTLYLQTGMTHSCHHPPVHKIPLTELATNYRALHNTSHKKQQMQMMLDGERPSECDYCWRVEDMGDEYFSDRVYKSGTSWSVPFIFDVLQAGIDDITPTYMEISFSNVCNLKCAYCSPDLSSKWYEEIKRFGPYPTTTDHNGFDGLKQMGKMPIPNREVNPYVNAFWEWWPELYSSLKTLRLTGGEPLMSKDCWRVFDKIQEAPREDLVLGINTNLDVDEAIIDRFIEKMLIIGPSIKELQIFTSGESTGAAAEYTRYGINYDRWMTNCHKVLAALSGHMNLVFPIMTTVNIFSVGTFDKFLGDVLALRSVYISDPILQGNIIPCMTNFLRYPTMLSIVNLDDETKRRFDATMRSFIDAHRVGRSHSAFLWDDEINQIERMLSYMHGGSATMNRDRDDFVTYVNELDMRRSTDFAETFPELSGYYSMCKDGYNG